MVITRSVIAEYRKWRDNWDDLCARCGQCCYGHSYSFGVIVTDFSDPCEYLDEETNLCRVYEDRFRVCKDCGNVNLIRALFYPFLPPTCAYVQTFRPLLHNR